eukprot:11174152-Lingulodinium_polyedra.AAC.1
MHLRVERAHAPTASLDAPRSHCSACSRVGRRGKIATYLGGSAGGFQILPRGHGPLASPPANAKPKVPL